jgi:ABC-type amino acid transport substrate-binding protein
MPADLTVGVMSCYVPFAVVNQEGDLEGFDIDVAREIAMRLGRTLVLKDMSLAALLIALQQGKVDLVLSGLSITKARSAAMTMIQYQGQAIAAFPLVFYKQVPVAIKTIEDIKNYPDAVICVEPGSSEEEFLAEQYPSFVLKRLSMMSEIIMDLKYGKSLAAVLDPDILPTLKEQNPDLVWLWISLPKEYQIPGNGIALDKKNSALADAVKEIVATLKTEGFLAKLEQQWFKKGGSNDQ